MNKIKLVLSLSIYTSIVIMNGPALAASDKFFSLNNTNFVVSIAFILFIGLIIYFKIPNKVITILDQRAKEIQSDIDLARQERENAQSILAAFKRKQKDVQKQVENITANAEIQAKAAAVQAKADLEASVVRRLQMAEENIKSARIDAIRHLRNQAATIAVKAAEKVIADSINAKQASILIDQAIIQTGNKLPSKMGKENRHH